MEMSILSLCSGRGFVHFFAMAALLNVALTNLKNGLVRQNENFFLTHQCLERPLDQSLMDFQNFTDTLCVFLAISTVITFLH